MVAVLSGTGSGAYEEAYERSSAKVRGEERCNGAVNENGRAKYSNPNLAGDQQEPVQRRGYNVHETADVKGSKRA